MKKIFVMAVIFIVIGVLPCYAQKTCKPGGLITASGVLSATPKTLCGVLIIADGTNPATITLYNNKQEASGEYLWPPITVAAGEYYGGAMFPFLVLADQGIYVSVSGTGAKVFPYYDAQ
jgi:hypothetical protein